MFKQIGKSVMSRLGALAMLLQACWAEFGEQECVNGFKTNSSYDTLGSQKYIFMIATAAGQANQATNATSSTLLGVLQNAPKVGEAATIAFKGLSKIVAGGAVSANAIITTNASGRAAVVASGQMAAGRLLEASGADGDVVTAQLFHPVRWTGAA